MTQNDNKISVKPHAKSGNKISKSNCLFSVVYLNCMR